MSKESQTVIIKHYGVSPWEINVITSLMQKKFYTNDEEFERDYESKFVSMINVPIPYSFDEEFFKWFEYKEWEKVKGIFKEMKRRRGDGKAIKINLSFAGDPLIRFIVDSDEGQWFRTSVEKIDFVLELLPYHLDPKKLPENVTEIVYSFDINAVRWRMMTVVSNGKEFLNSKDGWKMIT